MCKELFLNYNRTLPNSACECHRSGKLMYMRYPENTKDVLKTWNFVFLPVKNVFYWSRTEHLSQTKFSFSQNSYRLTSKRF